jgi:hypothetical protein
MSNTCSLYSTDGSAGKDPFVSLSGSLPSRRSATRCACLRLHAWDHVGVLLEGERRAGVAEPLDVRAVLEIAHDLGRGAFGVAPCLVAAVPLLPALAVLTDADVDDDVPVGLGLLALEDRRA